PLRTPPPTPFLSQPTAPTQIYTLSLHDALPIYDGQVVDLVLGQPGDEPLGVLAGHLVRHHHAAAADRRDEDLHGRHVEADRRQRSEEHTSELQSPYDLVCRLLLEKKKKQQTHVT